MLDRQQLVCTLGASVVMSETDALFSVPRPCRPRSLNPAPVPANAFSQAVRILLTGSTSLGACLPVD